LLCCEELLLYSLLRWSRVIAESGSLMM